MTDKLSEYIKEKRPDISPNTIKTYKSILSNLYFKVFGKCAIDDINFNKYEKEEKEILEFLKDKPASSRKTTLSALYIITKNDAYREQMLADITTYNGEIAEQEKTPSQKENWLNKDELDKVFDAAEASAMPLLKKKKPLITKKDLLTIQNYILLCLMSGKYIPPRRSLDYCQFKVRNIDKSKDNYFKKDELVFNTYKTAKIYKEQRVKIPDELVSILKSYIKINPNEYLLFDLNGNPLTSVKLSQRFNKIFGKKISTNMLRHQFLTHRYGYTIEQQKEMNKTFQEMGSSTRQATTYIKKDD